MDRAFKNLDSNLAGSFGSLKELASSYEKSQTLSEKYLDGTEKLYELSKLNR
jgi:hypothetical protein